ncbi:hypothetical protein DdX_19932 [Ditylenchus destructor]|uniref:Uncharacterized protein n=1 Tax=Ditylenchus destructor TaxID=166010 RepID=A0AAD4MIW9_9BILA|nr:hypothetical protein DdX_19932 [Ditylenchus destructor]
MLDNKPTMSIAVTVSKCSEEGNLELLESLMHEILDTNDVAILSNAKHSCSVLVDRLMSSTLETYDMMVDKHDRAAKEGYRKSGSTLSSNQVEGVLSDFYHQIRANKLQRRKFASSLLRLFAEDSKELCDRAQRI